MASRLTLPLNSTNWPYFPRHRIAAFRKFVVADRFINLMQRTRTSYISLDLGSNQSRVSRTIALAGRIVRDNETIELLKTLHQIQEQRTFMLKRRIYSTESSLLHHHLSTRLGQVKVGRYLVASFFCSNVIL